MSISTGTIGIITNFRRKKEWKDWKDWKEEMNDEWIKQWLSTIDINRTSVGIDR